MMSLWLGTAFLTGLISSLHCVGMCGPLVAALPVGRLPLEQRWRAVGLYHASRIATYSVLGALAGALSFGLHLLDWQRPLAVGCGVILLISLVVRKTRIGRVHWPWLNGQVTTLFRQGLHRPGWSAFMGLGALNGLLPCGFTYLALAGTLASKSPVDGAAYMLLFGLGTLPALLSVHMVAGWLTVMGRQRLNRVLSVATLGIAMLLIGRGLSDYQLPISPSDVIPLCHGLLTR